MKLYSYFRWTQKTRLEYFGHNKGPHYRNKASKRCINQIGVLNSMWGYQEGVVQPGIKNGEHYWILDQTLHSLQGKGTEMGVQVTKHRERLLSSKVINEESKKISQRNRFRQMEGRTSERCHWESVGESETMI